MHAAIRLAAAADREALQRLINEAFVVERLIKKSGGDRLDAAGRELDELFARGTFLVCEENGELAACVYLEPRGDHYYLGLLSVCPHRQGSGLGRQMALASEEFAKERGGQRIDLRVVSPRRDELVPFYAKLGYTEQGTQDYPPELAAEMELPGHFILMAKEL
ncbi:MAG TPA: GNAT family N-acetyltransferase [Bryobacteraceae bacterium]|nr:GNAT family N-acetyltransferase [Bryobacteraceae bacterium]